MPASCKRIISFFSKTNKQREKRKQQRINIKIKAKGLDQKQHNTTQGMGRMPHQVRLGGGSYVKMLAVEKSQY